ncbi:Ank3, partial [Symbiodinium sp. CCMP2456]
VLSEEDAAGDLRDSHSLELPAVLELLVRPFCEQRRYEELKSAAEYNRIDLEFLLREPQDPDMVDDTGWSWSALHGACHWNSVASVELLIEAGSDLNMASRFSPLGLPDTGATPLIIAVDRGHHRIAQLLLEASANADARTARGLTALSLLAGKGPSEAKVRTVQLLIQARASVLAHEGVQRTPLHAAVQSGDVAVVEALLEARSAVNALSPEGLKPLQIAFSRGDIDCDLLGLLLRRGADVTEVVRDGGLHLTATRAHVGAMELLLEVRADVNRRDSSGNTALAVVRQHMNGLEGKVSAMKSEIERFRAAQEVLLKASRNTADGERDGETDHP